MDGAETQRQLVTEHGNGLIIIAVTASVFEHQRQSYRDAGFTGFIDKPLRAEQVYQALEELAGVTLEMSAQTPDSESTDVTDVVLPDHLVHQMRQAVDAHSITDLRNCVVEIDNLGADGKVLANVVRDLANRYEIDAIGEILDRITDGNQG